MGTSTDSRRWTDWGIPVGLALTLAAETLAVGPPNIAGVVAIQVAACAPLVLRRRFPMVTCLISGWLGAVGPFLGAEMADLAAPILLIAVISYSLARWVPDYRGLIVLAAILLGITGDYLFADPRDNDVTDVFFVTALLLPPYVGGRISRKLAEQSDLLLRQQDLVREAAVRDERDRIARELHDVIAHSVSAMVVQTAAAQDLVHRDPATVEKLLADVAATGRRALAETGRLLHVIRDADGELGLAPSPGLAQVPELVERFRTEGLDVDLEVSEPLPTLPPGIDVSAYRIVQEALTNALRYAPDRAAALRISGDQSAVRIHAVNRCNGSTGLGTGLGLIGMRERVAVLGGTLLHGSSEHGTFEVDATLPVGR